MSLKKGYTTSDTYFGIEKKRNCCKLSSLKKFNHHIKNKRIVWRSSYWVNGSCLAKSFVFIYSAWSSTHKKAPTSCRGFLVFVSCRQLLSTTTSYGYCYSEWDILSLYGFIVSEKYLGAYSSIATAGCTLKPTKGLKKILTIFKNKIHDSLSNRCTDQYTWKSKHPSNNPCWHPHWKEMLNKTNCFKRGNSWNQKRHHTRQNEWK